MRKIDRRGWIKIVEAFVAILLIAGVLLTVFNKGYIEKNNDPQKIYDIEGGILSEIQLNDLLRSEILSVSNFTETPPPIPQTINKINFKKPEYLTCKVKICEMEDFCILEEKTINDVYARSVIISSGNGVYSPRQLKLFCSII